MTILIATGMVKEARLMAGPGRIVVTGGGDGARLDRELDAAAPRVRLILSSGLAGGLAAGLAAGDIVLDGPETLVERLRHALPHAHVGAVLGSDTPVASVEAKARAARDGALAVDMESHIVRRVAARHGLPCLVVRVISDDAGHALPPAALAGMRPDGRIALGAVLASLARHPGQIPALIHTAIDAGKAFRALGRLYDVPGGGGIGGLDLVQLALDMG